MFDSEVRTVWLSKRNASIAARHVRSSGHSASGVRRSSAVLTCCTEAGLDGGVDFPDLAPTFDERPDARTILKMQVSGLVSIRSGR